MNDIFYNILRKKSGVVGFAGQVTPKNKKRRYFYEKL